MRVLVLNADYPSFLNTLYLSKPGLENSAYGIQMAARNESLFGVADFYSKNFRAQGHVAEEIHVNNPWLQYAWAREHGLSSSPPSSVEVSAAPRKKRSIIRRAMNLGRHILYPIARRFYRPGMSQWEAEILAAQIERFLPDLILNQDIGYVHNSFLRRFRKSGRRIVGQIASALPHSERFDAYDLVISSLPNFVDWFRARMVPSELNRLAFEPSILNALGPQPARDIDLSFVGSLSIEHAGRIAWLEHVARNTNLKVWGSGIERLPASSPLHARYQGEAWGRDMYEILRRSRITLNFHIDLAEGWANNMRLYEATGMGAMLLTDNQRNLAEIFTPGRDVAAYADPDDCVKKIAYYLEHEDERAAIAASGQARAINVQNYYNRTEEIARLVAGLAPANRRST